MRCTTTHDGTLSCDAQRLKKTIDGPLVDMPCCLKFIEIWVSEEILNEVDGCISPIHSSE